MQVLLYMREIVITLLSIHKGKTRFIKEMEGNKVYRLGKIRCVLFFIFIKLISWGQSMGRPISSMLAGSSWKPISGICEFSIKPLEFGFEASMTELSNVSPCAMSITTSGKPG